MIELDWLQWIAFLLAMPALFAVTRVAVRWALYFVWPNDTVRIKYHTRSGQKLSAVINVASDDELLAILDDIAREQKQEKQANANEGGNV